MQEPDAGSSELPELVRWESVELGRQLYWPLAELGDPASMVSAVCMRSFRARGTLDVLATPLPGRGAGMSSAEPRKLPRCLLTVLVVRADTGVFTDDARGRERDAAHRSHGSVPGKGDSALG